MAKFAIDPDVPAALFDHAIHRGEPQPGPSAGFLGGEEWFENASLSLCVHADAGIGYGKHHVRSGFKVDDGALGRVILVELNTRSFDS